MAKYRIEYCEKKGLFEPYGPHMKKIVEQEELAKMLQSRTKFFVTSARYWDETMIDDTKGDN